MMRINLKELFAFLFNLADSFFTSLRYPSFLLHRRCFKKVFYRKEGRELLGRYSKYFWKVLFLFFVTILAIGFANDSLRYLEHQMSSPFVRHLSAEIRSRDLLASDAYQAYKTDPALAEQYLYSSVYEYSIFNENFDLFRRSAYGRTVLYDDPLIEIILGQDNKPLGHAFLDYPEFSIDSFRNYGLIVTYDLLRDMRHSIDEDPPFLIRDYGYGAIPILAIVDDLPDNVELVTTAYYYDVVRPRAQEFFRVYDDNRHLFMMLDVDPGLEQQIQTVFDQVFFEVARALAGQEENLLMQYHLLPYTKSFRPTTLIQLDLSRRLGYEELNQVFTLFQHNNTLISFLNQKDRDERSLIRFYDPAGNEPPALREPERQAIGITFEDLRLIREFRENFEYDTNIQLEMSRVHQLENYYFVTILTIVVSTVLIFFSFLLINVSVSNMIGNHLNKIKMNIGTYKAFGIEIKGIYKNMVLVFIMVSQLVALALCLVLAEFGVIYRALKLVNPNIAEGYNFFYILNLQSLVVLLAMLVISFVYSSYVIKKLFSDSPGDLVYNREKQK